MTTIGTGSTLSFSGFSGEILELQWSGIERASVDITDMGLAEAKAFVPEALYDPGEIEVDIAFDGDESPPIADRTPSTVTVSWSGGASWSADGFCTEFEVKAPLEGKMVASMKIKLTGPLSF